MATSEGIPSSIDIEFLELNDNPYNSSVIGQCVFGFCARIRRKQVQEVLE